MSEFSLEEANTFERLVRTRRSVRGYLDKRVPEDLIQRIFETARWSPSGTNVQPWHICVASGETLKKLRNGFVERFKNKTPIVTDHAPHEEKTKTVHYSKAAFGISGIETSFALSYTYLVKKEVISLNKLIASDSVMLFC